MDLKRVGVQFDRVRVDLNENFDKIEGKYKGLQKRFDNAVDEVADKAFDKVVDRAKIDWLPPVDTFDDLATTYPDATEGQTVMTRDTGKVYRMTNGVWMEIQDIDPTAINEVDTRLSYQMGQIALNVMAPPYDADGSGQTDVTAAINAAAETGRDLFFPAGYTFLYTGTITVNKDRQKLHGGGTLIGSGRDARINVDGNKCAVSGLKFKGTNGQLYTLVIRGNECVVTDNVFEGDIGHHIFSNGTRMLNIKDNKLLGEGHKQTTPIVITGESTNFQVSGNVLDKCMGFGIQTRWSWDGVINSNSFNNVLQKQSAVASGGESYLPLEFEDYIYPGRGNLYVNNQLLDRDKYRVEELGDKVYQVVFLNYKVPANAQVTYECYKSLEPININSESHDIVISNSNVAGSGDSGIVLGADYHNRVLDPDNVDESDYPYRISVVGGSIKKCAYAGVAQTHRCDNTVVSGVNVSDCGVVATGVYSTGIYIANGSSAVTGNAISNTATGQMEYGITHSGRVMGSVKLGLNTFSGIKKQNHLFSADQNPNYFKRGIGLLDNESWVYGTVNLEKEFVGKPDNDGLFRYTVFGGTGWRRSTSVLIAGKPSAETVQGQYVDIFLDAHSLIENSIVSISFYAVAKSGAKGFANFYYRYNNVTPPSYSQEITETRLRQYTIDAVIGQGSSINDVILRIGSDVGSVNVGDIQVKYKKINP